MVPVVLDVHISCIVHCTRMDVTIIVVSSIEYRVSSTSTTSSTPDSGLRSIECMVVYGVWCMVRVVGCGVQNLRDSPTME